MIDKEIIQANHYKPAVKVVLLGNSGAGKTSLAQRFVYNKFNHYSESTIGASFFTKYMILDSDDGSIGEGATSSAELQQRQEVKSVKFHVWDTAGQEKYHSLAPMYYRGASAAILVYDICNAASFETLPTWLQRLKEFGPPKDKKNDTFIIIIVGNKCDLDNERQVMRESAEWFASQQGCLYIESSAREDIRVEAIFQRIAKLLPEDTISCFDTSGNGARNSKSGSSSNGNDGIFKLAVQPPQQGPNTFSSIRHGVCGC